MSPPTKLLSVGIKEYATGEGEHSSCVADTDVHWSESHALMYLSLRDETGLQTLPDEEGFKGGGRLAMPLELWDRAKKSAAQPRDKTFARSSGR